MTADKRSVATDALEVLGTVITDKKVGRDAVHLACLPVIVGDEFVIPGQHVGFGPDGTAVRFPPGKLIGIIDPFITAPVYRGSEVLLLLYPRTIESLRHVWSHPDVPDEPVRVSPGDYTAPPMVGVTATRDLLIQALDKVGRRLEYPVSGKDLLDHMDGDEWIHTGADDINGTVVIPQLLWEMFRDVHGRHAKNDPHGSGDGLYFSCAC